MRLSIQIPKESTGKMKCTIHLSGRLGFTITSAAELGVELGKGVKIYRDEENLDDTNLYISIVNIPDENAFRIYRAGKYFYLKTKRLFSDYGLDFINNKFIYDINDFDYEGTKMFKLTRRDKRRTNIEE